MQTLTIKTVGPDSVSHTVRVRTADPFEAVNRAVMRVFGRSAYFFRNAGTSVGPNISHGTQYGEILAPCRRGGASQVLARVSVRSA